MSSRRREGPRVLVVSPHYDDVPLSLGQSLRDGTLSRCRVEVAVVFGRTNWTRWVHPTPGRAPAVGLWRRGEELAASLRFGYRYRTAGWAESLLRTGDHDPASFLDPDRDLTGEPLVGEVAAWLRTLAGPRGDRARVPGAVAPLRGGGSSGPDLVLVCAGLGGHVDHRIVATAAAGLLDDLDVPVGFYEDRPYVSHLTPEERDRQLAAVLGPRRTPVEVSGPVQASTHRRVRRCYPSQIDEYFVSAMQCDLREGAAERVWFASGERPGWL